MSLLDVFSGRQSLLGWITGRDPKESDVYANYDKVETVSNKIRDISKNQVLTAQESIYAAFNQLNSVKGLAEYVGTIEVGNYDTVFTSIGSTIEDIAAQLDGKAEDIKKYEESSLLEKGLSKSSAKGKVHSNTSLPQETGEKSINNLTLQYSCLENPMDGGAW